MLTKAGTQKIMRALLLIFSGVVLCLVIEAGIGAYWKIKYPLEAIKNSDYNLVQIADRRGEHLCDLHKGESKLLPYGTYKITIADTKVSFSLWKNNRGFCNIRSSGGVLIVETDGNCGVGQY